MPFSLSGVLEISFDLVQDVLGAASFLQVSEAMDLCSRFLESKISLDTIVSILNLGEFYNMERLILKARMFCLEHFDSLADNEDFLRLDEKQIHFLLLVSWKTTLTKDSDFSLTQHSRGV